MNTFVGPNGEPPSEEACLLETLLSDRDSLPRGSGVYWISLVGSSGVEPTIRNVPSDGRRLTI